jgi:hypothetical protein
MAYFYFYITLKEAGKRSKVRSYTLPLGFTQLLQMFPAHSFSECFEAALCERVQLRLNYARPVKGPAIKLRLMS